MHFHHRSNTASNTSPKGREREREQHTRRAQNEQRGFQGEENDIIQPKRLRPRFELSFEPSVRGDGKNLLGGLLKKSTMLCRYAFVGEGQKVHGGDGMRRC